MIGIMISWWKWLLLILLVASLGVGVAVYYIRYQEARKAVKQENLSKDRAGVAAIGLLLDGGTHYTSDKYPGMDFNSGSIIREGRFIGAKEAPDKMTAEVALGYFMGEKQERIVVVNSGPCRLKKPDGSEFVIQSNVREMEQGKTYQVSVVVLNAPVDFSQQTSLTGSCRKAWEKLSYGLQVRQELDRFLRTGVLPSGWEKRILSGKRVDLTDVVFLAGFHSEY